MMTPFHLALLLGITLGDVLQEAIQAYRRGDLDRAATLAEEARKEGYVGGSTILGRIALIHWGDVPRAMSLLREAAGHGDIEASYLLGTTLLDQAERSAEITLYEEGVRFLHQASEGGHPDAQYRMGIILTDGRILPRDYATALALLEKAAAQGHPYAAYEAGMIHLLGKGVPVDASKALIWLEKADRLEVPQAAYQIAVIHEQGLHGEVSTSKALSWYVRAASLGEPFAQHNLAVYLQRGLGGASKNLVLAWALRESAVRRGYPPNRIAPSLKNISLSSEEQAVASKMLQTLARGKTPQLPELVGIHRTP